MASTYSVPEDAYDTSRQPIEKCIVTPPSDNNTIDQHPAVINKQSTSNTIDQHPAVINKQSTSNLWNKLKTKIKAAQKVESISNSFIQAPTPEQRETSLRSIIEQFQTRVMHEVLTTEELDQEDEAHEEEEERRSKLGLPPTQINRKWTTDKFTSHRHRIKQIGKLFQFGVPLFDFLIVIGIAFNICLLFPQLVSFQPTDPWMYDIQVFCEVILILYYLLNLFICYRMQGIATKLLSDIEQDRREFLIFDFFACLPLNILIGRDYCFASRYMCSLPMALNVLKLPSMMGRIRKSIYSNLESSNARKNFSTTYRAVRIILIMFSVMNVLSCLWYFIGTVDGWEYEYKDWFRYQNEEIIGQNYDKITRTERWIQSLYYSMLILIGDGVVPRSSTQHAFCALMMVFGTIGTAVLIGETANIINKMAAAKSAFELKMESLDYMMGYLGLPRMLQYRVREYYEFLWEEHRCLDGNPTPFVSELSPAIKSEVDLFLKRSLILQSDLFSEAPSEFIRDVSSQLTIVFYLRGDYVVREKEAGHSMYFISRGTLRVCIRGRYIKDLKQGDCFGEIAILRDNSKRSASVYAHTHCTLYTLNRLGVHELAALHPGVLEKAIALHYQHSSPAGKRQSLVFGRRASVNQFRLDQRKAAGGGSDDGSTKQPTVASPKGAAFIALETIDDRSFIARMKSRKLTATKDTTVRKKSNVILRRRQSQSMLGLDFRFQLVLNTLHLESEAYQFALLGCECGDDVQNLNYKDLMNISEIQFNRLQKMCETTADVTDSEDEGSGINTDSDEDKEKQEPTTDIRQTNTIHATTTSFEIGTTAK